MKIIIPGEPIAKKRPRFSNAGKFARAYDCQDKEKKHQKKHLMTNVILQDLPENDLKAVYSSHLDVSLSYHMSVPDSASLPQKNLKLWGFEFPMRKDIDNLCKWTLDICNGLIWQDDQQIVRLTASQSYNSSPCTVMTVTPIKVPKMQEDVEKVFRNFSPIELVELYQQMNKLASETIVLECESPSLFRFSERLVHFANTWTDKLKKIKSK